MRIVKKEWLKNYTSMKVGGEARIMYFPESVDDILEVLNRESDVVILGRMTNVLISDYGLKRAVMVLGNAFSAFTIDGMELTACAGLTLRSLSDAARIAGIGGLEFLNGIPGTLGGAVWMNAGAYGPEIKDVLVSVTVLREGELVTIPREAISFGTRFSDFQATGDIIVRATLRGYPRAEEEILAEIAELNRRRAEKQPLTMPSCGSVFKRPEGHYASALIDGCGLKGLRIGGAQVSPKHAGFIVNTGNATCSDVVQLIDRVKKIVRMKTGVVLEEEVRLIDDGVWL